MQTVTNELLKYVQWNDSIAKVIPVHSSYDHDPEKNLEKKDYTDLVEKAYKKGDERLGLILETMGSSGNRVSELQFITVEAAKKGEVEIHLKRKARKVLLVDVFVREAFGPCSEAWD